MIKRMGRKTGMKFVKLVVVTAAVYLGMKFVFPVMLPFLIALVLARVLYPAAKGLEKKLGFSKASARFLAYGALLAGLGIFTAGLLYLCFSLGEGCLSHMDDIVETADRVLCICCSKVEQVSGIGTVKVRETINREISEFGRGAVKYSKEAGVFMAGALAKIFVTLIASFLILNDYEKIVGAVRKNKAGQAALAMLGNMKAASGAYLRAQFCIMGIVTAVCIGGLFLLGIPFAFWIGLGVGAFDALPFFGTGTIFVPWALIELLLGNYKNGIGLFGIYIICNFIRQIFEPRLVGNSLGIPPVAVLMSIYIGLYAYGAAGVLLGPLSGLLIIEICRYSLTERENGVTL